MSNRKSYYINSDGPDKDAVRKGLSWLIERSKEHGGGFLAVPVISNLQGMVEDVLGRQIVKDLANNGHSIINGVKITLITDKKMIYSADKKPILALYVGEKILDKLDSISDIAEILVFPWIMDEIKNWKQTWNAAELGKPETEEKEVIDNPVVVKALESLTASVNLSTGISHPRDRSRTIWTFKILKENHEQFSPEEVKSWLISKGKWRATAAQEAAEIAKGVLESKAYHAGEKAWVHNIIDMWREEAGVKRDKRKENPKPSTQIQRTEVSSSNIYSIGYDKESKILEIEFHRGGIYRYFDVPEEVYSQLMDASSHGKYFAAYIKPRYNYTRIL